MIDAAIPLQTTPPINVLNTLGQLQNQRNAYQTAQIQQTDADQRQQSNQLKINDQQQGAQDNSDYRAAMAAAVDPQTGQVDRPTLLSTLAKLNPTAAAQTSASLQTQDTAAAEAKAKAQAAQLALVKTHLDLKDQILQGVTDPVSYANARNIAIQNGISPNEIPPTYDPQWVAQAHAQTMTQKDALDQHLKQQTNDRADRTQAETEDNNAALREQAAATAAETARHNRADEANTAAAHRIEAQRLALQTGDPNAAGALLANHDATLSELKARGSTPEYIVQALNAAKKINPNFNPQQDEAYFAVAKSPTNEAFFTPAKSLTDKGGTLDQLAQAANDIPGHKIPTFNSIDDARRAALGDGPIAKYAALAVGVADDYSKVMGGGTGSDTSRLQAAALAKLNASPEQRAGSLEGIRGAVTSQMKSRIGANPILQRMYGDSPTTGAADAQKPSGSSFFTQFGGSAKQ